MTEPNYGTAARIDEWPAANVCNGWKGDTRLELRAVSFLVDKPDRKGTRVYASTDRCVIGSLAILQLAAAVPAQAAPSDNCDRAKGAEIVVCGSRTGQNPYRIPKLPDKYQRKPIRAETDAIPGVHTRAHVESEGMPDGQISKRLMVTFSVPF